MAQNMQIDWLTHTLYIARGLPAIGSKHGLFASQIIMFGGAPGNSYDL